MLGNAVVVLVFIALLARPWVRAMRGLFRRRSMVEGWGTPSSEPPSGAEAEAVVLRGRLEADGPIEHLPSPEAIAATLNGTRTGNGHLSAKGLRLRMGEAVIPIEGRVEVRVGADEEHPRSMPEKTEYLFAESMVADQRMKRPWRTQLRRIASGTEVRVRGHLERRAADGGQYREGAHGWALVAGKHGEAIEVAAESPGRVRFPMRDWVLRALGIGTLVFALLPFGLHLGGKQLARIGNDTLRDCDSGGHSWLRAAEWVARAESAFPGFGEAALERRARALRRAVNGVRVCRMNETMAVSWVEPLIEWAERTLPAITEYEYYENDRNELENTLHEAGLDRAIVALQAKLPRGGDVTERVRAHLYLGDLQGAVDTWSEPGAHASLFEGTSLQKGVVLCMAGHHEEAMEAFQEQLDDPDLADYRLKDLLFRAGMCALRADDLETAERMADAMEPIEYRNPHQVDLRAHIASARGERIAGGVSVAAVRELAQGGLGTALLAASQLADAGEWVRLLEWFETDSHELSYRLGGYDRTDASLYNPIFVPVVHEPLLARLAEQVLEGAQRLETLESDPEHAAVVETEETGTAPRSARMRLWAGKLHRYRAALLGRRWDPRAGAALDAAEGLLGTDAVHPLREALAFFHGDWRQTKDSANRDLRNLSRFYLRLPTDDGYHLDLGNADVGLAMLNPNELYAEREIAALYNSSRLSDEERWAAIRDQKQSARWPVLFYRLTHVIAHGENLGMDVSAHREQLEHLQTLVNGQSELQLFMGSEGASDL